MHKKETADIAITNLIHQYNGKTVLDIELYPTLLFEYQTIKDLSEYLFTELENKQ